MFLSVCVFERELIVMGCFPTFKEAQDCMIDDMVESEKVDRETIISHAHDSDSFEYNEDSGWSNSGGNNSDWTIINVENERKRTIGTKNEISILFQA